MWGVRDISWMRSPLCQRPIYDNVVETAKNEGAMDGSIRFDEQDKFVCVFFIL